MAMLFKVHVGQVAYHLPRGKNGTHVIHLRIFPGTAMLGGCRVPPLEELRGYSVNPIQGACAPEDVHMRLSAPVSGWRIVEGETIGMLLAKTHL